MNEEEKGLSMGNYLGKLILFCIPVVNVAAAFVWGFASDKEEDRNFGRASLIVIFITAFLFIAAGAGVLAALGNTLSALSAG